MSIVDNYVLLPHHSDDCQLSYLNAELGTQGFCTVREECGGSKYLEMCVWTSAMNYYSLDNVLKAIRKVSWSKPSALILLHCSQEGDAWNLIKIFDEGD